MTEAIPPKPANLINGVERNREAPGTFEIPSRDDVLNLTAGDYVKIGLMLPAGTNAVFRGSPVDAERFWVKVEGVQTVGEEILIFGQIDNDLEFVPDFAYGATISFGPENVLQIIPAPRPTLH